MRKKSAFILPVILYSLQSCIWCAMPAALSAQQTGKDSLAEVIITARQHQNSFAQMVPSQQVEGETLRQLNSYSAADIAKYFAGVLVKDYGGVGGLKTVSVRSLGASQTGVLYDGVTVADMQSGQVDLGKFSTSFLAGMELSQAFLNNPLLPARATASAALLSMHTQMADNIFAKKTKWTAGIKAGSFGQWQPFAAIAVPLNKRTVVSANAEYTNVNGDYPYWVENGNLSEKKHRNNSALSSFQSELNATTRFADSSLFQLKAWGYFSDRGLPGAVIFFNDYSRQHLWNNDFFIQSNYKKNLAKDFHTSFVVKYNYQHTRYTDPDFLNNNGGIDNRYKEQEWYASAAANKAIGKYWNISAATDIAYTTLTANLDHFAYPSRISSWTVSGIHFAKGKWQAQANGLYTYLHDQVKTGSSGGDKNKLTPTVAVGYKPGEKSPFLFRVFYKNIFRMPSFNDLYYTLVGNRNLKPEYANQYNAGISYTSRICAAIKRFSISADGYYNLVKDKIVAVPGQNLFVWSMLNAGKVQIAGIDLTSEVSGTAFKKVEWQARIAYTYQHTSDRSAETSSTFKDQLPYTPNHSGSGFLQVQYHTWAAGYSLLFSGSRYTLGGNNSFNQLDAWATHDISLSRQLFIHHCTVLIKAEGNNLTNKRYDIVRYFPMQGRSFKINFSILNF